MGNSTLKTVTLVVRNIFNFMRRSMGLNELIFVKIAQLLVVFANTEIQFFPFQHIRIIEISSIKYMTTIKRIEPGERDVEEYICIFCRSKIAIKVKDCRVKGCFEQLNVKSLMVWTHCPVCDTINLPQNISVVEVEQWETYKDKFRLN